jgi:hypothetical protein
LVEERSSRLKDTPPIFFPSWEKLPAAALAKAGLPVDVRSSPHFAGRPAGARLGRQNESFRRCAGISKNTPAGRVAGFSRDRAGTRARLRAEIHRRAIDPYLAVVRGALRRTTGW